MIYMVNNGTGYETPPQNGTSTAFLGYVFAFNVTTPNNKTTNTYFNWWPPCNTNLGLPCEQNNTWELPDPENSTINYATTNLYILWYTNSTGLYVSFQEWGETQVTTTVTVSSSNPSSLPSNASTIKTIVSTINQTCISNCTVLQASYWCNSQGNDCSAINPSCIGPNPNCVGTSPTNNENFSNGEFSFYFPSGAPSSISLTERCSGVPITAGQPVICNALEMLLPSSGCPVIFPNGQASCNFSS